MADTQQKVPLNFIVLMTFIGTVAYLASDIYISAMPSMAESFGVAKDEMQSTFTIYMLGVCLGQFCFGLLLDQFDVKRVAMISLAVFVAASFACATANTLSELIWYRFFQAFGASVCSVVYRSLTAARYNREQVAQILAIIFPIASLSPAIAPFIGGVLKTYFGWQSIFIFTGFYGIAVFIFIAYFLRDNAEAHIRPMTQGPETQRFSLILLVFKNRIFWGYTLIVGAAFAAFRTYTAESPFVFHYLGFSALEIGHFYLPLSISYLAGNILTKKLLNQFSVNTLMKAGLQIMLAGGLLMVALGLAGWITPISIILSISVVTFSNGFLLPCGNAAALTAVPSRATGLAAALIGITQLSIALLSVYLTSHIAHGQFLPLACAIFVLSVLATFNYITFIMPKIAKATLPSPAD
jgi:MFS transporter, DHA1 family, multidrug resistance protein